MGSMRLNVPVVDVVAYEKRLNNSQLAKHSRVTRQFLLRLRRGERTASLGTIQRIADALGVPVEAIVLPHESIKAGQK